LASPAEPVVVMEPGPGQALARKISTEDLAGELMERAQADGVNLIGPGGLLGDLTKRMLELVREFGVHGMVPPVMMLGPVGPARRRYTPP